MFEMSPNKMNENPIKNIPKETRFLLPNLLTMLPTNGLQIITATEYMAKM